jgi:hypothetical protein
MPPHRRSASGNRGVRARPNGRFDAEIRSEEERIRRIFNIFCIFSYFFVFCLIYFEPKTIKIVDRATPRAA